MNTENFSQKIKLQKNPHFHKIPSKSISTIKSLLNFPKKKKRWEPIRISSSKKNTRKRERTELSKRDFYSENLRTYLSTLLRIISMIALRPFWEQGHRRKVSEMRQWRKSGGCDRPVFMKRIMAIVVIKYGTCSRQIRSGTKSYGRTRMFMVFVCGKFICVENLMLFMERVDDLASVCV